MLCFPCSGEPHRAAQTTTSRLIPLHTAPKTTQWRPWRVKRVTFHLLQVARTQRRTALLHDIPFSFFLLLGVLFMDNGYSHLLSSRLYTIGFSSFTYLFFYILLSSRSFLWSGQSRSSVCSLKTKEGISNSPFSLLLRPFFSIHGRSSRLQ